MATVTIQRGHCFRKKGRTGTICEQQIAASVGQRLVPLLQAQGHTVHLICADEAVPHSDIFVSVHTDGRAYPDGRINPSIRGASVGYPDTSGGQLAAVWKQAHQRWGYPGGWHTDNYTNNLASYYGFGTGTYGARRANPSCTCFLAELGTTTNPDDLAWIQGNLDACACSLAEAIAVHTGIRPVKEVVKVQPRLSVFVAGTVVDAARSPNGGVWLLTDLGAIYAWECPDYDAPNRHPEYWQHHRAAAFKRDAGGNAAPRYAGGYTVVATDGSEFDYGPK
jgi:hypothetical protein